MKRGSSFDDGWWSAMERTWRRLRDWVFGREERARIRIGREPPLPTGIVVCIPLAGRIGEIRADLALSSRFAPPTIREIVAYVDRRSLPVDGWILRGIDRLPFRCERAARWVTGLARASGEKTTLAVAAGRLSATQREQLAAHLERLHGRVDVDWRR